VLLSASACASPPRDTVTLAFLGDVMLGRDVYASHQDGDWEASLAAIAPTLQGVDLALANLESRLPGGFLHRGAGGCSKTRAGARWYQPVRIASRSQHVGHIGH